MLWSVRAEVQPTYILKMNVEFNTTASPPVWNEVWRLLRTVYSVWSKISSDPINWAGKLLQRCRSWFSVPFFRKRSVFGTTAIAICWPWDGLKVPHWLFFELVLTKDKLFHFTRLIDKSGSFYLTVHKKLETKTLNAQSRGKNSFRLVAFCLICTNQTLSSVVSRTILMWSLMFMFRLWVMFSGSLHYMWSRFHINTGNMHNFKKSLWSRQFDF